MIRLTHKFCYSHTTLKITKTLQTLKKSINSVDKFCQFCYQDATSSVLSVSYPLQRTALQINLSASCCRALLLAATQSKLFRAINVVESGTLQQPQPCRNSLSVLSHDVFCQHTPTSVTLSFYWRCPIVCGVGRV